MENHGRKQETYAFGTPIDRSSETTGLTGKMKIEIQPKQVSEYVSGNLPNRLLSYASKYSITQFLEHCGPYPRCTIYSYRLATQTLRENGQPYKL